jgi:transcriptional antiterminator RfaH
MGQWYTLYTKPNTEYQVATALQKRGVQTYLPEIESPRARQGQDRKPLFPCYLFIKVDFEAVGLSHVQWVPGLRRIVAVDNRPVPLPDEIIDLIRRRLDRIGTAGGRPAYTFQPGDTVRITDGPLQGLLAIFERPTTSAECVQVLLEILGDATRAWVSATDLEKVPPKESESARKRPRRTRGRDRRVRSSTQPEIQST